MFQPLHGLVAATHSPFHPDGSLAPEIVPHQAAWLAGQKIGAVFITGSTGESHSLTRDERVALMEAWADAGKDKSLRVIAHVGGNCLEDCRFFTRKASDLGLDAVSALAPSYYKPATLEALVTWCASIAAEAPELPFYYYDIPALTGVTFPMDRFLEIAAGRIPNLAGIKYTNPDLVSYRRSLEVAGDRFDLPWGVDETMLAALATGAKGSVGSTHNFAAKLNHDLIAAFERGDLEEARGLQTEQIGIIDALASIGYLGAAKAVMGWLGVPVGPTRQPIGNPTPAQLDALRAGLEKSGFFESAQHQTSAAA